MIGVGSQGTFEDVQDFIETTPMPSTTLLWERSGSLWDLNEVASTSSMQLFSYDLDRRSRMLRFNDKGRSVSLDAAVQTPWKPAQ